MSNQKLTFREKVGYSTGDMAANLVFQMMMIFQLKFYTDVFGLDGAIAGSILLIARFVDAFVDPLAGIISDRTHTRWGKYRPWVIWTAIPFCVFYILAFYNPGIESKAGVAVYATISYILLMSCYSFNNTPYSSLGGVITSDIKERTSVTSIRFVASTIAQFVVQGLTLPLVSKFGTQADGFHAQRGWLITISIFAAVAFCCFLITFFSSHERIAPPPSQKSDVKRDMKDIFGNTPWRAMFVMTLFIFITLAMWGSAMNFYFQNYVDQNALYAFLQRFGFVSTDAGSGGILGAFNLIAHKPEDAYSIGFSLFNMVGAVIQFLGVVFLSQFLANRYGKKSTFIVCLSLTTLFTAMFYLPGKESVDFMFVLCILKSLAYAPTVPLLWAMIADVADHMEYVNHRRATGFCFSGVVFSLKAGLGLGGAFAGLILSGFGYVSGGSLQSASAIEGIRLASSIVPACTFFIGVVALFFYPITKKFNESMQAELTERRSSFSNDERKD
jgi:GPH family glycoside/pentoside/hexuronide:cation symporter